MTNTVKKTVGRPVKAKRTERPIRVPMSGGQKRMHIDEEYKDSNYHYAWVNDQKDFIFRSKRAGFVHVETSEIPSWGVTKDVDSAESTANVISMNAGRGVTTYLMKQPMEFYEEDQKTAADEALAREQGMKQQLNSGQDGTYGEVKFS